MMNIVRKLKNTLIKEQEGFTLLEILLSVGIFGFIALSFIEISQNYIEEKRAIVAAEHMKTVHEAAYQYVMDNFEDIYAVQLGGDSGAGNRILIPIEDDGSSPHFLKQDPNLLPASFNEINPFRQRVVILVRNNGNRTIEIVAMSTGRPVPENQIQEAASLLGGYGGVWSPVDRDPSAIDTTTLVVGAFGMWSVPVTALATPTWPNTNTPTVEEGGYLASYQWINYPNELGDYLYRVALPLAPEANQMMTDIDMNNYNIDGADDVTVNGSVFVQTSANFSGSARIRGTTVVTQDMSVDGTGNQAFIRGQGIIQGQTDAGTSIVAENFTRDAGGSGIIVENTVSIAGSSTGIDTINTETASMASLTMDNSNLLSVTLDVGQINITGGTLEAGRIVGGSVTDQRGNLADVTIQTMRSDGGTTTINGSTVIGPDLVVQGTATIDGGAGQDFSCNVGC